MNKQDVKNLKWLRKKWLEAANNPKHKIDFRCGASYARATSYICWNEKGQSNLPVKSSNAPDQARAGNPSPEAGCSALRRCEDCAEMPDDGTCDKCGDSILTTKDAFVPNAEDHASATKEPIA